MDYLESGRDATLFLLSWHQYLHAKADLPLLPTSSLANSGKLMTHNETPLCVSGTLNIQVEGKSLNNTDSLHGDSFALSEGFSNFKFNQSLGNQQQHESQSHHYSLSKITTNGNFPYKLQAPSVMKYINHSIHGLIFCYLGNV